MFHVFPEPRCLQCPDALQGAFQDTSLRTIPHANSLMPSCLTRQLPEKCCLQRLRYCPQPWMVVSSAPSTVQCTIHRMPRTIRCTHACSEVTICHPLIEDGVHGCRSDAELFHIARGDFSTALYGTLSEQHKSLRPSRFGQLVCVGTRVVHDVGPFSDDDCKT